MKVFIQWLHMVLCVLSTVFLLIAVVTPSITKELFLVILIGYIYMLLVLIALLKKE